MTYHSLDTNRSYSVVLSGACVSVLQQAYDLVISIKLSELAMGIHGAVEDHVINTFKGVHVYVNVLYIPCEPLAILCHQSLIFILIGPITVHSLCVVNW